MSILDNAVESIQVGMEDYDRIGQDKKRVLSAIRNLYAGILLLFKYKLQQLSPKDSDEVLLKAKISPKLDAVKNLTWVGKGKKTVEVFDIKERLISLGITGINWKILDSLQDLRNNIEHYYSREPLATMQQAIASSVHLITQFCEPYLEELPVELLGKDCWEQMLKIQSVYDEQLKECRKNLESVDWDFDEIKEAISYMRCPSCQSELIKKNKSEVAVNQSEFTCSKCSCISSYEEVIAHAIDNSLVSENHIAIKDGGEPISITCPECNNETFIVNKFICVICNYEPTYQECQRCYQSFTVDEISEQSGETGLCNDCDYY